MGNEEASEGFDGAAEGVTAASLGDNFAATLVFLGGKVELRTGGLCDVVDGGLFDGKLAGANVEVDVAKGEGLGVGSTVLGRAEQEEEGDADGDSSFLSFFTGESCNEAPSDGDIATSSSNDGRDD